MENITAQREEILVLQSIYEEKEFLVECMNSPCGRVAADISLPQPFYMVLRQESILEDKPEENKIGASSVESFELEYLPPINLFFEFPTSYPSQTCPAFLLSCQWLNLDQLTKLCKHLEYLWEESYGEVILFRWIQFLKEEVLEFLNISDSLDITELSTYKIKNTLVNSFQEHNILCDKSADIKNDSSYDGAFTNANTIQSISPSIYGGNGLTDTRAVLDLHNGKALKSILKDFNVQKKHEKFQNSWHICDVCFIDKKGSDFSSFRNCQHFFCTECVKTYFEVQIKEGNINSLFCLYEKCGSQADGTMVKSIVSKELFERYDTLLLSHTLENMPDIVYCPRKDCQCPLLLDSCGKIGSCPACKYVFCPFCKMTYHGVAPCDFKSEQRKVIFEEYMNGDAIKKVELEKLYGKKAMKALIENTLSESWVSSNSKSCPHCKVVIEKNDGCNKMTCFKCGSNFCWLCLTVLKTSNPYVHYAEKSSECYDRLFPYEFIDDEFEIEPGEFLNI